MFNDIEMIKIVHNVILNVQVQFNAQLKISVCHNNPTKHMQNDLGPSTNLLRTLPLAFRRNWVPISSINIY